MVGRLMFLLDTNVWLELLLNQEKAGEVRRMLEAEEARQFALTDFSLYSLGIILTRLKKDEVFLDFLSDTLEESAVRLIRLDTAGLKEVPRVRRRSMMRRVSCNFLPRNVPAS